MKMKIVSFLLLCFFASAGLSAQTYDVAAGLRMGTDWGVTGLYRVAKKTSLEAIVQNNFKRDETTLTVMARQHHPFLTRRLNIYMGGGVHYGFLDDTKLEEPAGNPFGVTGVIGAEMTFGGFNISYDFKPALNVTGGAKTIYSQSGVSVRYILVKREWTPLKADPKAKKKRQRKREKRKKQRQKDREKNGGGFNWKFWEKKS